jgi:hypothetical protein
VSASVNASQKEIKVIRRMRNQPQRPFSQTSFVLPMNSNQSAAPALQRAGPIKPMDL